MSAFPVRMSALPEQRMLVGKANFGRPWPKGDSGAIALCHGRVSYSPIVEQVLGQFKLQSGPADRVDNKDDFEKAYRQTFRILDSHDGILGFYNIFAGSRGIGHALQERGQDQSIIFVGHEVTRFTCQPLIEGIMDAVINQDIGHETHEALRNLITHHIASHFLAVLGPPRVEIYVRENLPDHSGVL